MKNAHGVRAVETNRCILLRFNMTEMQKNKRAINAILKASGVDLKAPWPFLPQIPEFGVMTNQERWFDLLHTHGFAVTLYEMALHYGDGAHRS